MAKKNNKKNLKRRIEEIELSHSRIQLVFSAVGGIISVVSLIISLRAIGISKSQNTLEYNQSLPNFNMSMVWNDETGENVLDCQIVNDGGVIREAEMTPHMFLTFSSVPFLGAHDEKSIAIELMDFFSPYYGNGIYYTSTVPYNPMENNWRLAVEKFKISGANELLFQISRVFQESPVMISVSFCLEIDYIDIMGEWQVEWYDATNTFIMEIEEETDISKVFQLARINNDSGIPLQVYQNAVGINVGDNMMINQNTEEIDMLSQWCYESLFGSKE